jgi:hypothetical protein
MLQPVYRITNTTAVETALDLLKLIMFQSLCRLLQRTWSVSAYRSYVIYENLLRNGAAAQYVRIFVAVNMLFDKCG